MEKKTGIWYPKNSTIPIIATTKFTVPRNNADNTGIATWTQI